MDGGVVLTAQHGHKGWVLRWDGRGVVEMAGVVLVWLEERGTRVREDRRPVLRAFAGDVGTALVKPRPAREARVTLTRTFEGLVGPAIG